MVSYWRSPGGHCGSSFSSVAPATATAVDTDPASPSPSLPLSKKDPEKSRAMARTVNTALDEVLDPRREWHHFSCFEAEMKEWEGAREEEDEMASAEGRGIDAIDT